MATYSGRNASVKLGSNLIGELGEWNINPTAEEIDTTVFGSEWGKSDVGFLRWTGAFTGFHDPADTNGQAALWAKFKSGALVTDIRFYMDTQSYYTPDVTTDTGAGCRITSMRVGHTKGGVASVEFTVTGSGPIALV